MVREFLAIRQLNQKKILATTPNSSDKNTKMLS